MQTHQVALQLYTLRDHLKTPRDTAATLRRVSEIGYRAVQVSGIGPIETGELARMLSGEGLVCASAHEGGEQLLGEPERVADRLRALDCRLVAFPHPGNIPLTTRDDVSALAKRLNASGRVLREHGVTLCYHNHHTEFRRIGSATILELLYEETDPDCLQAELDTYWVQFGGGDPVTWCERMANRLPMLHLKDYAINEKLDVTFAEIGNGNLDWPRIMDAAERAGCQWYAVEQDTCPGDPFASVAQSFAYITEHLCRDDSTG